jgi:uncharacterized membrane-anchored protein
VLVLVEAPQVLPMFVQGACLVPALGDAGVILPFVESSEVLVVLPIDYHQREMLIEVRDIATVDD